ncbi:MAG: ABC transporter ATP-binding protein [Solirubrobacteraceae bacterium]|nr:ABC transporter ATP-binding protein [Solirubrobacteraceae bacterium]
MTTPALRLDDVHRSYGERVALSGVSLTLEPGDVCALLGPNGAGKSTLVGLAAGLAAPDRGTVRVLGDDPRRGGAEVRRRVGLAPQDIGIYPTLTVRDNLRGFGELAGLSAREARARAAELAGMLLLDDLLDRPAGQLSGGQQRRVHTAIALVARPAVVLLDEPTAGADVQTRQAILEVVRGIATEGAAVLYATHYLPEVEDLDAGVALLMAGEVLATGSVARLIAAHAQPAIELRFAGGDVRYLPAAAPGPELPAVLDALAEEETARLVAVELVQPSLETAYLALTGTAPSREEVVL